jgi:hypothetical protein
VDSSRWTRGVRSAPLWSAMLAMFWASMRKSSSWRRFSAKPLARATEPMRRAQSARSSTVREAKKDVEVALDKPLDLRALHLYHDLLAVVQ